MEKFSWAIDSEGQVSQYVRVEIGIQSLPFLSLPSVFLRQRSDHEECVMLVVLFIPAARARIWFPTSIPPVHEKGCGRIKSIQVALVSLNQHHTVKNVDKKGAGGKICSRAHVTHVTHV